MLKNREIRESIKDMCKAMLQAPDAAVGWTGTWTIYNETQFRSVGAGTLTPTFPYIYLLDSFLQPVSGVRGDLQQPQVVVEIDSDADKLFEMGNRKGRMITAMIHVFGMNRAQRDDLGSFFKDYMGNSVTINTYPSGDFVESALIEPNRKLEDIYTPRADVVLTGMLLGWSRLTFQFLCKL